MQLAPERQRGGPLPQTQSTIKPSAHLEQREQQAQQLLVLQQRVEDALHLLSGQARRDGRMRDHSATVPGLGGEAIKKHSRRASSRLYVPGQHATNRGSRRELPPEYTHLAAENLACREGVLEGALGVRPLWRWLHQVPHLAGRRSETRTCLLHMAATCMRGEGGHAVTAPAATCA